MATLNNQMVTFEKKNIYSCTHESRQKWMMRKAFSQIPSTWTRGLGRLTIIDVPFKQIPMNNIGKSITHQTLNATKVSQRPISLSMIWPRKVMPQFVNLVDSFATGFMVASTRCFTDYVVRYRYHNSNVNLLSSTNCSLELGASRCNYIKWAFWWHHLYIIGIPYCWSIIIITYINQSTSF